MSRPFSTLQILILFCILISSASSAKNILIVDSYHQNYPWTKACRQGFESQINRTHQLKYYEMNTKSIPESEFENKANAIWQQITLEKPDLIVTMDDNALKYLGQRIADAGYPLIFMGVSQNPRAYFQDQQVPANVTGILEIPLIKPNMAVISVLIEKKKARILMMMDEGTTSNSFIKNTLQGKKKIIHQGITLDIFPTNNFDDWKTKVEALPTDNYDALIISSFANMKNNKNNKISYRTIAGWTSANSTVPMFTVWSHAVRKGNAVGGLVISGQQQGENAAMAVNTTLSTGKMPAVDGLQQGHLTFSRSELARWKMTLPSNIRSRSKLVD